MDHLLNLLAVHHPLTPHDLKKEPPDQVDLPINKHNPEEIVAAHEQATGSQQKITEQNARYLLPIQTRREL